jgi:1-acyl-sn-glycerol-3-phosphate acyltransferase
MKLSLDFLAHAALETAKISVPTVLRSYVGKVSDARSTERLRSWAEHILERADVRVKAEGLEHVDSRQSYVVMSNHQSLYDIPILFHTLPLEFRMVAKTELFWVPVWGRAMLASGFVRVDRKRGSEARAELRKRGRELQSRGLSLWIAPEGTRSPDGSLLPFKTGGFHLALSLGLPILPVRIDGALKVLSKQSQIVSRGQTVNVTVYPPIVGNQDSGTTQDSADVRFERAALRLRDQVRSVLEVERALVGT